MFRSTCVCGISTLDSIGYYFSKVEAYKKSLAETPKPVLMENLSLQVPVIQVFKNFNKRLKRVEVKVTGDAQNMFTCAVGPLLVKEKKFKMKMVMEMKPDLVIGNKEENTKD